MFNLKRNYDGVCKGCQDRCADPNCHTTCERFLLEQEKRNKWLEEVNKKKGQEKNYNEFKYERVTSTKKYLSSHRPRTK